MRLFSKWPAVRQASPQTKQTKQMALRAIIPPHSPPQGTFIIAAEKMPQKKLLLNPVIMLLTVHLY